MAKRKKKRQTKIPNHAEKTTNPTKKLGELGYARGVSSSCSTSNTVVLLLLKIGGHLWQRYSVTFNQVMMASAKLSSQNIYA